MKDLRILVVEDEPKLASFIKKGLEDQEWQADVAYDGSVGYSLATQNVYNIIILDVGLPLINGFDLAKQLRATSVTTPILMLTALGATEDKLEGFESGADDYLVKPFEFAELVARIKALHKRTQEVSRHAAVLKLADLEVNVDDKTVKRSGKRIDLTAKEFMLLAYLMRNKGKVVSRTDIAEKVWNIAFDTGTNVIDVYINFLRKKIDRDFGSRLIHTVIGMGYIMREDQLAQEG
jgi:DNA-binding response OmpR family regulator